MARVPTKTSTKPAESPLRKAAKKVAATSKPDKTATATAAVKPSRAAKVAATTPAPVAATSGNKPEAATKPVAAPVKKQRAAKAAAPAKPVKPPKPKAEPAPLALTAEPTKPAKAPKPAKLPKGKGARKSVLQETSARISQLAADILADRIVPTIEQIKAIAASALGHGEAKGKKAKRKKK
ncbi:hypothetical protein BH10PSE14_BH10PSE14_19410 [soil metagenome]